jgi:hypothetical protein
VTRVFKRTPCEDIKKHTEGKIPYREIGQNWNDETVSQGTIRIKSWQERKGRTLLEPLERSQLSQHLGFGLLALRIMKVGDPRWHLG